MNNALTEVEDMLLGLAEVMLKKVHWSMTSRKKKPKTYPQHIKMLEIAIANIELMRVKTK